MLLRPYLYTLAPVLYSSTTVLVFAQVQRRGFPVARSSGFWPSPPPACMRMLGCALPSMRSNASARPCASGCMTPAPAGQTPGSCAPQYQYPCQVPMHVQRRRAKTNSRGGANDGIVRDDRWLSRRARSGSSAARRARASGRPHPAWSWGFPGRRTRPPPTRCSAWSGRCWRG